MNELVERPQHLDKKIHSKNEFELCYLRHQYLRKVKFNPTEAQMRPYHNIIRVAAKRTYFTYTNIFKLVGFEVEDVINIGKIHLVSYLGLFAVDQVPAKYDKFFDKFYEKWNDVPDSDDILDKDKADFTMFLKQRMEDVVRVCRQKAKNIKGLQTEEYLVYYGKTVPPMDLNELATGHEKFGYRKLDVSLFKSLKKKIKTQTGPVYILNGLFYVTIPVDHRNLSVHDIMGSDMNPYNNIVNMTPEELLSRHESDVSFEAKKANFMSKSQVYRDRKLRNFIDANKNDPRYTQEVRAARKMLK